MKKKFEVFELPKITGEKSPNFTMNPVELKDYIDFTVKRIYYLTSPKAATGQHCHKVEKEFFIVVQGKMTAVIDQGNGKEDIYLEGSTSNAIYCANFVWHGFKDFSDDAILLALSSTNYSSDRSDYVEDYEEYIKLRDKNLRQE